MTKDSEHITHALYCSNVHVIYSIYWTSILLLQLKPYTGQHSKLEVHHVPTRSIVNYWLTVGKTLEDFLFSLHIASVQEPQSRSLNPSRISHMVPKFNQSTMITRAICPSYEVTVKAGTAMLCVTLKN